MAKNIINTNFGEAVCPVPGEKSNDWGGDMGTPISDAVKGTEGVLGQVQFVNIKDGEPGSKGFGPGKK
jgi:hypothetical protein